MKKKVKRFSFLKITALFAAFVLIFAVFASCSKNTADDTDTEQSSTTADTGTAAGENKGITYEATYDENGKQNGQKVISADGTLQYTESWDTKGRVTDVIKYNPDGTEDATEHIVYDGEGDTVKSYKTTKYHYSEENGELENYNESYFNSKEQLTDSFSYEADGTLINICKYAYDQIGNTIHEEYYGSGYDLQRSIDYEYNEKDQITKETYSGPVGEILAITQYEYNEDGTVSKQSECDPDGSVRSYCVYVYAAEGEAPEEQIYIRTDDGEYIRYN